MRGQALGLALYSENGCPPLKSRTCSRSHHTTLLMMTPSSSISHWTSSPFCNGVVARLSVLSLTHTNLHIHTQAWVSQA